MSNRRTVAMVVNDNAGNLTPRSALRFIASMLAPTGGSQLIGWEVIDHWGSSGPIISSSRL
ncbi:hypothetical protein CGA21_28445 [Pseudomonas sp. PSB11]|jgi:hypothetical protein|nr:hypothetical protein [Pseudomonas sp. PSB11]